LHGILNLAEFGMTETTTEEKDSTLKSILKSAHYLSNIVNDILDFSKIEAGKLEIEHIDFDLNDVISDVIKPQLQRASTKGIKLITSVDSKIADNFKGDPLRVSQILNNLCSNAIKFTKTGQVELKVSIKSSTLQTQVLKFEVIDTGLGINETVQEHLFKEFHQADSSTSREYGGTGLGLSICARLSELMQGHLSFTSQIGKGSTFTYEQRFEIVLSPIIAKQSVELTNLQGCTVLIAEDNKINQLIIVKMLKVHNADLIIAENGKECVKYFKEHPVDLIFMDIQMPEIDGIKATQAIRSLPTGKIVPIIAMTANTLKQDIEHYLDIGMDGYLTKPFDKAKLNSLLNVYNPKNLNLKNLAVKISDPNVSSNRKLNQICKELKALIPNANRVSLWLFNKEYSALSCLICLDENDDVSSGAVLNTENSPAYFNYILTNQVLDASDARNNEVTESFTHSYFEPLNIYSLLDYTYKLDNKPLGVICCESVDSKVTWSHADKESLVKVADVTNLFLSKQIKHE
jgi:CheY-like chemotaxis protein